MATHSSTLAWKIPWMEEPGGLQSMGRKESNTAERPHFTLEELQGYLATVKEEIEKA